MGRPRIVSRTVRRQDDLVALSRWYGYARRLDGLTDMDAWHLLGCALRPPIAEAARWLSLQPVTVGKHRSLLYAKLGVGNVTEAALIARRYAVAAYASLARDAERLTA